MDDAAQPGDIAHVGTAPEIGQSEGTWPALAGCRIAVVAAELKKHLQRNVILREAAQQQLDFLRAADREAIVGRSSSVLPQDETVTGHINPKRICEMIKLRAEHARQAEHDGQHQDFQNGPVVSASTLNALSDKVNSSAILDEKATPGTLQSDDSHLAGIP